MSGEVEQVGVALEDAGGGHRKNGRAGESKDCLILTRRPRSFLGGTMIGGAGVYGEVLTVMESLIFSKMAGPMPETFWTSSGRKKRPDSTRYAMMRWAMTGPMP